MLLQIMNEAGSFIPPRLRLGHSPLYLEGCGLALMPTIYLSHPAVAALGRDPQTVRHRHRFVWTRTPLARVK